MWPYLQARMTRTVAQVTKEKVPQTLEVVEPLCLCQFDAASRAESCTQETICGRSLAGYIDAGHAELL